MLSQQQQTPFTGLDSQAHDAPLPNAHPPDSYLHWKHKFHQLSNAHRNLKAQSASKDQILVHTMKNRDVSLKKMRVALNEAREIMRRKDETMETILQMASIRRLPLSDVHTRFRHLVDQYESYLLSNGALGSVSGGASSSTHSSTYYSLDDVHRCILDKSIDEMLNRGILSVQEVETLRDEFAFNTRKRHEYSIRPLPVDDELREQAELEELHERQVRDLLTPTVEHGDDVFEEYRPKMATRTSEDGSGVQSKETSKRLARRQTRSGIVLQQQEEAAAPMKNAASRKDIYQQPNAEHSTSQRAQLRDMASVSLQQQRQLIKNPSTINSLSITSATAPQRDERTTRGSLRTLCVQTDPIDMKVGLNPYILRDRGIQTVDFSSDVYDLYFVASKISDEVKKITSEHKAKKRNNQNQSDEVHFESEMHFMLHNAKISDMINLSIDMALNPDDAPKCSASLKILESVYKKIARVLHQVVPKYARKKDTLFHLRNDARSTHQKMHTVKDDLRTLILESTKSMEQLQLKGLEYVEHWSKEQNDMLQAELDKCLDKEKKLDGALRDVQERHRQLDTQEDALQNKGENVKAREEEVQREKKHVQSLISVQERDHKELTSLKLQLDQYLQKITRLRNTNARASQQQGNGNGGQSIIAMSNKSNTLSGEAFPMSETSGSTTSINPSISVPQHGDVSQLLSELRQEAEAEKTAERQQQGISALLDHKELENLLNQHRKFKNELEQAHISLNQEMANLRQIHVGSRDYGRVDRKIVYRRQKIDGLRDRIRRIQVQIVDFLESQQFAFPLVDGSTNCPEDMSLLSAEETAAKVPEFTQHTNDPTSSDVIRDVPFKPQVRKMNRALKSINRLASAPSMHIQSIGAVNSTQEAPQVKIQVTAEEGDTTDYEDYLEGRSEAEKLLYLIALCDAAAHVDLLPQTDVSIIGEFLTCCNKTSSIKLQPILQLLKKTSRTLHPVATGPSDQLTLDLSVVSSQTIAKVKQTYQKIVEQYISTKDELYEDYPTVMQQIDIQWNSGRKLNRFFKRRKQIGNLVRKSTLVALRGDKKRSNVYDYRGHLHLRKGKKDKKGKKSSADQKAAPNVVTNSADNTAPKKAKVKVTLPSTTTHPLSPGAESSMSDFHTGGDSAEATSGFPSLAHISSGPRHNYPEPKAILEPRKALHLTNFALSSKQDLETTAQTQTQRLGRARKYLMSASDESDFHKTNDWNQHRQDSLPVINIGIGM
eukprot:CAMPEP_0117435302 /NCGR_PEP_ID=MMETSP0759-20121206/410_1 /TAXON_ID=63605 /ORGANISM="Percolomonas cosmopolitus, Strain WS" /LENGTH=1228 /DNA_ID=CAMNT_0005226843 /DNA_START=147 /DNA_END=3833 /DNA_ORIENTATION=-